MILALLAAASAAPQTFTEVKKISIVLPIGDITMLGQPGTDTVTITSTERDWAENCALVMIEEAGETRVRVTVSEDGHRRKRSEACTLDLSVLMPPHLSVKLDVGIGDIRLNGLTGPVELDLGVGDLTTEITGPLEADIGAGCIQGSAGLLDADVGAGSVRLAGLSGDAHVSVSAGDVGLTWLTLPNDIDISVGAGSVLVTLPDGSIFEADLDTGIGGVNSLFEQRDGANSQVEIDVGVGNISIIR
ncbi:MAG: hypothetical protein ACI8RZ_001747 [Myxococcota bacterium]|jgi:hypothetical protein